LLFEQLAHQPQRRAAVALALNQHVEHLALVIDGMPEVHALAGNPHHHPVQMPSIARPKQTAEKLDHRSIDLMRPLVPRHGPRSRAVSWTSIC
jgi:hypothetical protein